MRKNTAKGTEGPSSDEVYLGNEMPAPLSPVDTGNADADEAIRALQANAFPGREGFDALVARARVVGADKLADLLDDAALSVAICRWSDAHLAKLGTRDRKFYKKRYDEVVAAGADRDAYLRWLLGETCTSEKGFRRAKEALSHREESARLLVSDVLARTITDREKRIEIADALDLRAWDASGQPAGVPDYARGRGVMLLSLADSKQAYERYASLLAEDALEREGGVARAETLLWGLRGDPALDRRWDACVLPLLGTPARLPLCISACSLLANLDPSPAWVLPLCNYLPKPNAANAFWLDNAVKALARAADARALPWLIGALHASWMNWPAVFEGFRRVGDASMAHVIRDWMATNGAPDREKVAAPLLLELERNGVAPRPDLSFLERPPPPPRARPVLTYEEVPPLAPPKLDDRETIAKTYRAAFEAADLAEYFEELARPAVWLVPERVNEATLPLGVTKLGGHPDLPPRTKWPRVAGAPLTFVAQLSLSDFAPHVPEGELPKEGLLSFFIGLALDSPAGYCEKAKVLFTPSASKLERCALPEDYFEEVFQAAKVTLHPTLRLPSPSHPLVRKRLRGAKAERYASEVFDETAPLLPQVLGYRDQGYDGESKLGSRLLLQLPGDSQTDMEFGDVEVLGFYIDAEALRASDFAKIRPRLGESL